MGDFPTIFDSQVVGMVFRFSAAREGPPNTASIFPSLQAGNVTTVAPAMVLPSKIVCGDNAQISPGRVKMSLYGYTWGKNWESDVAGQDLIFFRWRLCFESRSWYINQVLNGEGGPTL